MAKFKCIDLFCGCGGLSEGFKLAGYDIVGGVDFNSAAIKTYNLNFGYGIGVCCDLLTMDKDRIFETFGDISKVDVIIGGPPCQGFSSANRYKTETSDPRNKLFFEFVKFVDMAKPKAVVIENVSGIVTKDNGYAKDRIEEIFSKRGYSVVHQILNASEYGVPQKRKRNFFVMLKHGAFSFETIKKASHIPTVLEAIGELYNFESNEKGSIFLNEKPDTKFREYLRAANNEVKNHEVRYPAKKVQDRIAYVPQGGNWKDVPAGLWPTTRNNRQSSAYKRLSENEPSVTIDTGNNHSNYFHPLYNRIPTVREAARLQSFPDSFEILGNRSEQYRQIGNAVPPLLAKAIAMALKEVLKNEK